MTKKILLFTTMLSMGLQTLSPLALATTLAPENLKKQEIYANLTDEYVKDSCSALTNAQKDKIKAIDEKSLTAKYTSFQAMLDAYEQALINFFEDDFVPNNCEEDDGLTDIKKQGIYDALTEQYVKPECKPLSSAQKLKIDKINKQSEFTKYDSEAALLADYKKQLTSFFTTDYTPNNCKAQDQGQGGGGGGGGGMCQLMQMLQMLIPAAAMALASGGTLGDAQAIGQKEMNALQYNQSQTDQTQDQKQERMRQMAQVAQGLAAITKMMSGGQGQQGQQQGGQGGQQGGQGGQGCGGGGQGGGQGGMGGIGGLGGM